MCVYVGVQIGDDKGRGIYISMDICIYIYTQHTHNLKEALMSGDIFLATPTETHTHTHTRAHTHTNLISLIYLEGASSSIFRSVVSACICCCCCFCSVMILSGCSVCVCVCVCNLLRLSARAFSTSYAPQTTPVSPVCV